MRVVLTGASGKLGGVLLREWSGRHEIHALGRERVDLRDGDALRRHLEDLPFDAIVNCAALSSPEGCEADPESARRVNTEAPGVLAEMCRRREARMIHLSTDYVLDGSEPGLKDESAPTGPVNLYGRTKLEGEGRVLESDPSALVCRVSWVFGTTPPGFLESFVERARTGNDLEAVDDKFSMPTCAVEVARFLDRFLDRPDLTGVLHLTSQGEPESWWSYGTKAVALARELGLLDNLKEVRRIKLADIPQLAVPRPIHTAMRPARLIDELGWKPRSWEEAARSHLA